MSKYVFLFLSDFEGFWVRRFLFLIIEEPNLSMSKVKKYREKVQYRLGLYGKFQTLNNNK